MSRRVRWPISMTMQAVFSAAAALVVSACVFSQIEMGYFNRFYFGPPGERYPYPFRTAHDADWALYSRCALAFFLTFSLALGLQRFLIRRNRSKHQTE